MKYFQGSFRCDFYYILLTVHSKWVQTLLSLIGIMLFVTSLIVMISISQYTQKEILKEMGGVGINSIRISSNSDRALISQTHIHTIRQLLQSSGDLSVITKHKSQAVKSKQNHFKTEIFQADQNFLHVQKLALVQGRAFLLHDIQQSKHYAIISQSLAHKYHINIDDIVNIDAKIYKIIGIAKSKSYIDEYVYIPLYHHELLNQNSYFSQLIIDIKKSEDILYKLEKIKEIFATSEHIYSQLNFLSPFETLQQKMKTQEYFNTIILFIAIMSLVSSGSSIMHMLLSNISEQTREIGLMKALGAREFDIARLFFLHALVLTFFGLLLGIILAVIILSFFAFVQDKEFYLSMQALWSIVLVSMITGTLFGVFPALRAAKISPLEALKEH